MSPLILPFFEAADSVGGVYRNDQCFGICSAALSPDPSNRGLQTESADKDFWTNFGPYIGPVFKDVNITTLSDKVMCGYQGWFGAPGDGSLDSRWRHWTKQNGPLTDGNAKVDFWPDMSELNSNECFLTDLKLADGRPAEVFSSYEKQTVLRHFKWMRDYGIDRFFVQRFATSFGQSN